MRRKKQEITGKAEIEEILSGQTIARLGINRPGAPYVLPINFGYKEGTFFFHCAGEGLKLDLIKKDPRVCIEVDETGNLTRDTDSDPCSWGIEYRSVIATGRAEFITGIEEKIEALNTIIDKFSPARNFNIPWEAAAETIVFKVEAKDLTAKRSG